jgi:hypothetical protein
MVKFAVATVGVSLFAAGCGPTAAPSAVTGESAPTADAAEPASPTVGATQRPEILTGAVIAIGPVLRNPDGTEPVLPLTARVRLPERRDMTSFTGTMAVRSLDDPARVLWSGPVEFGPAVIKTGDTTAFVHVSVPYDEKNPDLFDLARSPLGMRVAQKQGVFGPPAEIRLERIEYADGTADMF